MAEVTYLYDGSFDGLLCCIFESYVQKERPIAICLEGDQPLSLFDHRVIETDKGHAKRVYNGIVKRSPYTIELLWKGLLTDLPDKELRLFDLAVKLLDEGPAFLHNQADEALYPVARAIRHLESEAHLLKGFVRFSDFGGVLVGEIAPKNRVLPLLGPHFRARYIDDTFMLYDRSHKEALFSCRGTSVIQPLEDFQMAGPDAVEARCRTLWKRFYDTVAIKERENPRCRMTHMPKRYWGTMTEFQDASFFTPQSSAAAVSGPAAPAEISAPETPR